MRLPRSGAPALGLVALALAVPAAHAAVNWTTALRPAASSPHAVGSAQYQAQPGQRELQVEVGRLVNVAGRRVTIYVGRSAVGTVVVNRRGVAQWTRNTELGQSVPAVAHGTRIAVRLGGRLILSGRF